MSLFLKGIIIGLGKIIPGVSGSVLAITFGVYEKAIKIISNLKKELIKNIPFLFKLSSGIIVGIILGSRVIYFFLNNYYYFTLTFIIGLISSSIFSIAKKITNIKKTDYIYIMMTILFVLLINSGGKIEIPLNITTPFIVGFIDAFTMIIPGISGTAVLMVLGLYEFFLNLLSNVSLELFIFLIGLIIGIMLTSKIVYYGFKNYYKESYLIIIGFIISSILILLKILLPHITILKIILFFFGFIFGYFFQEK